MAAWPTIDTIPCGKHILLIPLCVKSSNLEFVCVGFVSTSQEVTGVALHPMNTLSLSFWVAELGMGLHKAVVSSVTGLGNLVHDRASRGKFDIVLILDQFLWIPVQNI